MKGSREHLFLAVCVFGLGIVVAVGGIAWRVENQRLSPYLLALFGLTCLTPVFLRARTGRFDPFQPPCFMSLMYFVIFGVLSLPFLWGAPLTYDFFEGDYRWLNVALLYLIPGMMFLWFGYHSPGARWMEKAFGLNRNRRVVLPRQSVRFCWIIILYLIGAAARLFLIRTGTYGYLATQSQETVAAQLPFAQWLFHIRECCSYALVLAAIAWNYQRGIRGVVAVSSILCLEILFGVVSGFRTPVFLAFLYVAIVYFYSRGKMPWRSVVLGGVILLLVFPIVPVYRGLIYTGKIEVTNVSEVVGSVGGVVTEGIEGRGVIGTLGAGAQLATVHMSRIQDFAGAVKMVDDQGLHPERDVLFLFPFLVVVPRAVWAAKPRLELGAWYYTALFNQPATSAQAATYPGGLYLYLGYWGYVIAMFLTGVLQRFAYRGYSSGGSLRALFFAPFLVLALGNPDSDFIPGYSGLIQQLMFLWIIARLAIARRPLGRIEAADWPDLHVERI